MPALKAPLHPHPKHRPRPDQHLKEARLRRHQPLPLRDLKQVRLQKRQHPLVQDLRWNQLLNQVRLLRVRQLLKVEVPPPLLQFYPVQ